MNPIVKINCIELTWTESKEKVLEWDNLLIESNFPHPFSSFTFYNSWVETFVDDLTQIKMLFFYKNHKLVGLAPIFVDQNNKSVSIHKPRIKGNLKKTMINNGLETIPSTCMFRMDILLTLGGHDTDLKTGIDHDLWMKIANSKNIVKYSKI